MSAVPEEGRRDDRAPALRCRGVERRYPVVGNGNGSSGGVPGNGNRGGNGTGERRVLAGVDLEVGEGALLAVLGPSGGGKTTLLRIVAGLDRPDAGRVEVLGREVNGPGVFVPPESRRVGLVFQDYALFPHLTALENASFGVPGPEGRTRAAETLETLGLSEMAGQRPAELSGGEQQRVALARALAPRPGVLLLDEPFSNLDAALRAGVREEVAGLLRGLGATAVLVTHDREEAFALADRVALLIDGVVIRAGAPEELARDPGSRAAARFLGETNFLPGESDGATAVCEIGRVELARPPASGRPPAGPVEVLLPLDGLVVEPFLVEGLADDPADGAAARNGGAVAQLTRATFHGPYQLLEAQLPSGATVRVRTPARDLWQGLLRPGQRVGLRPAGPVPAFPRDSA